MASEDLEKDLYKNWVRGAKGLEYLQEGLQYFVGEKVQLCRNQHLQTITNGLPTGSLYQCNQCTSQNLLPQHAKKKNACNRSKCIALYSNNCFGSKPNGRRKCPNGICSKLYDEIVLDHTSRDPLWKNTDPSTWCSDPSGWSFGKCFQTTISPSTSADTTDAAGLLSVLINNLTIQNDWLACNDMSSKIACPFNRARDIRNAILHSPKLELDDPTLGYYLDTFITVLQDAKCLLNCNGSKQAVDKLSQLKCQQINLSREDEKTLLKSRKEALSELDEKILEGRREIDNKTEAALSTLKRSVQEEKRGALSDLEDVRREAGQDVKESTKVALSDLEQAKIGAEKDVKDRTKAALSELEDARREARKDVKDNTKAALYGLEQAKIGAEQDVKYRTKASLSDLEDARTEARKDIKENTKATLCDLEKAKLGAEQHIKSSTKAVLSDLEQAKIGAGQDVKDRTKAALSDLEDARREARRDVKENTKAALYGLEQAKIVAEQGVKESTKAVLSDLEEAMREAGQYVKESTKSGLSDLEQAKLGAEQHIKSSTKAVLSDLEQAKIGAGQDVKDRTKAALSDLEDARREARRDVKENTKAALYGLEQAKIVAEQGVKESTKAVLSDLEEAMREAGQYVKESTKSGLSDLEQAKIGAEQGVKESTKAALSDLEEAKREARQDVKESTESALSDLEKARIRAGHDLKDISKVASSDLERASFSANLKVQEISKATQSDLEQARIGATFDIDKRKETSLSEIEVAKCDAIDQMKQQQTSTMLSGGEQSSTSLYSLQTSASFSGQSVKTKTPNAWQRLLRRIQMNGIKKKLKDDLITFYKDRHSTLPLSPLFEEHDTPLVDFYVLPQIDEVQNAFLRGEKIKTPVKSLSDVFKSGNNISREIYLTADAGFGKTAFSKYLAVTWCQAHCRDNEYTKYFSEDAIKAMREYEFLFLVLLRDSSDDCSIDDLIVNQIVQNLSRSSSMTIDSLQEILHSERCLVILDGLDEWTHTEKKCSKVPKTIPHRNAREKCTVLTTTRPLKLSVINLNSRQLDKKIELTRLCPDSARKLIRLAFRKIKARLDEETLKSDIKMFIAQINGKKDSDLVSVPLLLMYLICLWCDSVPIGQSRCGLYTSIIELLLSRTMRKYPEMEPTCEPSQRDIPQCFSEQVHCKKNYTFLKALGKLALDTLMSEKKENTLVFDCSMAEKYLTPYYLKLSLRSGILTQNKQVKLSKHISKVSFSHKSMQEYFCALYMSCENESDVKIVLQNCSNLQRILDMSTVLTFISGMNAKLISSISHDLMPVISADEVTSTFRSRTHYDYRFVDPVKDIQKMYISCIKENPDNDLKLCCQDFIIDEYCREESYFTNLKQLAIHNKNNMQSILIRNAGICSLHEIIDSCGLDDLSNISKIFYQGKCIEEELLRLLDRSVKCLTVISSEWQDYEFISNVSSCSSELCKRIQNISLSQAIHIHGFKMSHDVMEEFLDYIIDIKSMEEITLRDLYCTTHDACPGFNLDFTQHSDLKTLAFGRVPVQQLKVNISELETCSVGPLSKPGIVTSYLRALPAASKLQRFDCCYLESSGDIEILLETLPKLVTVKEVRLLGINLGERSLLLSPEMVNIECVWLWYVTMSASSLRDVVSLLQKLPHTVVVDMKGCNIIPETEFEDLKKHLKTSNDFVVTADGTTQSKKYVFKFQTKVRVE